ncbi:hypothetical protein HK096_001628, partial [Nowakowskiella sp. JEL0078]
MASLNSPKPTENYLSLAFFPPAPSAHDSLNASNAGSRENLNTLALGINTTAFKINHGVTTSLSQAKFSSSVSIGCQTIINCSNVNESQLRIQFLELELEKQKSNNRNIIEKQIALQSENSLLKEKLKITYRLEEELHRHKINNSLFTEQNKTIKRLEEGLKRQQLHQQQISGNEAKIRDLENDQRFQKEDNLTPNVSNACDNSASELDKLV